MKIFFLSSTMSSTISAFTFNYSERLHFQVIKDIYTHVFIIQYIFRLVVWCGTEAAGHNRHRGRVWVIILPHPDSVRPRGGGGQA